MDSKTGVIYEVSDDIDALKCWPSSDSSKGTRASSQDVASRTEGVGPLLGQGAL